MTDINKLLNTTSAGLLAQKLDAQDGNKDGKISGSVWNEFVEGKGGKKIREDGSISVKDAMNSITTYVIREAKRLGKSVDGLMQEWQPSGSAPAPTENSGSTPQPVEGTDPVTETPETHTPEETEAAKQAQVQADYESVKVTVPKRTVTAKKPENKAEIDKIINAQKEGKEVADTILKANSALAGAFGPGDVDKLEEALKLINKDNVAYVLQRIPNLVEMIDDVDAFGYGFDKDEVIEYVLKPLEESGLVDEQFKNNVKEYKKTASKLSCADMQKEVQRAAKEIRETNHGKVNSYNSRMTAYNKNVREVNNFNKTERSKAQKTFDDATKFMAEVANIEPKPEVKRGHNDAGDYDWAKAKLPDGRWINVRYDSDGEISEILISHDTTPDHRSDGITFDGEDIYFQKDHAIFNTDHSNDMFEGNITSGYDFEKLKALAEKIFGKKE